MILLVAFALFSLVVLPVGILVWLGRRSPCRLLWGLKALAVGSYVLTTYYLGGWQMLSYYGRYVLLGAFAMMLLYGGWRMRHRIFWARPEGWEWLGPGAAGLPLLLGGTALFRVNQSRQVPEDPVDLAFGASPVRWTSLHSPN